MNFVNLDIRPRISEENRGGISALKNHRRNASGSEYQLICSEIS